jgi:hypothetical protein
LAKVVEHLPNKCEALSSNPHTAKKEKKKLLTITQNWNNTE